MANNPQLTSSAAPPEHGATRPRVVYAEPWRWQIKQWQNENKLFKLRRYIARRLGSTNLHIPEPLEPPAPGERKDRVQPAGGE